MKARDNFASRFGFVLACVGSAVGLGNIWLFPRRVAAYGAPFLVAYLICVVVIGLSGVIGEMAFGRAAKAGPLNAFASATERAGLGRKPGTVLSLIPILTSFALAVGYSVVTGWILKYFWGTLNGSALAAVSVDDCWAYFGATASGFNNVVFHLLGLAIAFVIISCGISGGIEKANKFFMPLFFLMFIGVAIYVSTLNGALEGYKYMFTAGNWSLLASGEVWKYALGQAFFSLSLAGSGTLVYGSYLAGGENIPRCAFSVALFDTLAAFVAALAIIPAVYASGIDFNASINSGPGLLFVYLPNIFRDMPAGRFIAVVFFAAVAFAALSSLINLFECAIEALESRLNMKRQKAVCLVVGAGAVLALCITDIVSGWMDFFSIYMCPIGALLAALLFFWFCGRDYAADAINQGMDRSRGRLYAALGRWLFCPLSLLVLILGCLTAGGIG